ncbi:DUF3703 domain-containing protein [Pseudomonas sp. CC6-YY-74]|uniref:DUF3703 domain-containing protein n=1 Tax=Pseudomonas sp. CC6-YY-74 TaxID=1930532 RepID=UPI0015A758A2|nr:DUF3703 domain-containing protein [Pseudomonas sp. CC6-YY-74]
MTRQQAFQHEYHQARLQRGIDLQAELRHLERAHILGQSRFADHLRSHLWLLAWAWRQRDWAELAAQLLRVPGSLGSLLGWYPLGNPGTRRVGPLTAQPLPEDLQRLLE